MRGSRRLLAMVALAPALIGGCTQWPTDSSGTERSDGWFDVAASHADIVAGESVTLSARTSDNTFGRKPTIRWASTGGSIRTEDDGRVARVRFDHVGVYNVLGQLYLDDKLAREDSVTIHVRPVP